MSRKIIWLTSFVFLLALLMTSAPAAFAAPPDSTITFSNLSRIGGFIRDLTVSKGYAYLAVGYSLAIFDVRDPAQPKWIGSGPSFGKLVEGVAVKGRYAYLTAGKAGFHVIDINDATNPVIVSSLSTSYRPRSIAVSGNYAYLTSGDSALHVIDIQDASNPHEVGRLPDSAQYATDLAVRGSFAYLTLRGSLLVVDISNPTSPVVAARLSGIGGAASIQLKGEHAYLAGGVLGLQIINIADPRAPRIVGEFNLHRPGGIHSVAVTKKFAYLAEGASRIGDRIRPGSVRVVEITDPAHPVQRKRLRGSFGLFTIANKHLFSASLTEISPARAGALEILGLKNVKPSRVATFPIPSNFNGRLQAQGNMLYGIDDHLHQFDLTDPARPRLAHSLKLATAPNSDTALTGLALSGEYAYVGADTAGLHIVHLPTGAEPQLVATLNIPATRVYTADNLLFVNDRASGLSIYDLTDPTAPALLSKIDGTWLVLDLAAADDYLYIAAYQNSFTQSLFIYNISDPTAPQLTSTTDYQSWRPKIEVSGENAFFAAGRELTIFHAPDPSAIIFDGGADFLTQESNDMLLSGDILYFTLPFPARPGGILAFDVSNPSEPALVGMRNFDDIMSASIARLSGGTVVLGTVDGLVILQETVQ